MPRVIDLHPSQRGAGGSSLNSPTRGGLPYQDPLSAIQQSADIAGQLMRENLARTIKELTGIDITGVLEFFDWLEEQAGISIKNLGELWDNLVNQIEDWVQGILDNIWDGTGGLGDAIVELLDPARAKAAMEALNARIAAAVAQIEKSGAIVENFATYPDGSLGSKWTTDYVQGSTGSFGIKSGEARMISDVGFGGRRARNRYIDSSATGDDVVVSGIYSTAPQVGNLLGNAENELFARANLAVSGPIPAGGKRVFARFVNGKVHTGYDVGAGLVILKTVDLAFQPTATYALDCHGWTFDVYENARMVSSVVDTAEASARGTGFRGVGFETFCPLTIVQPGRMAAFSYRNR